MASDVKGRSSGAEDVGELKEMRVRLRPLGNSLAVIIPKRLLDRLGLSKGDEMRIWTEDAEADDAWQHLLSIRGMLPDLAPWSEVESDDVDEVDRADLYGS